MASKLYMYILLNNIITFKEWYIWIYTVNINFNMFVQQWQNTYEQLSMKTVVKEAYIENFLQARSLPLQKPSLQG